MATRRRLLLFLVLMIAGVAAARVFKIPPMRAVALARSAGDRVFVLEQSGTVSEVTPRSQSVRRIIGELGPQISAVDIASLAGSSPTVLVSANDEKGKGRLYVFYPAKQASQYWSLSFTCAGLDVDQNTGRVYIADALYGQIRFLDLKNPQAGDKFFVNLSKSQSLSPVAIDTTNHRLFVGDSGNGNVFVVDIQTKSASVMVQIKGAAPSALAFDGISHTLYVADFNSGTIYSVSTDKKPATARRFAHQPQWKRLTGISIRNGDQILVADMFSPTIFALSKEGKLLESLSGGSVSY